MPIRVEVGAVGQLPAFIVISCANGMTYGELALDSSGLMLKKFVSKADTSSFRKYPPWALN